MPTAAVTCHHLRAVTMRINVCLRVNGIWQPWKELGPNSPCPEVISGSAEYGMFFFLVNG